MISIYNRYFILDSGSHLLQKRNGTKKYDRGGMNCAQNIENDN